MSSTRHTDTSQARRVTRISRYALSHKHCTLVVIAAALALLALAPADALAAGTDVGHNLSELLKHYAGEVYAGIVAGTSLVFIYNRRYTELATFLAAAIVVGWMVFAPGQIGKVAEEIGHQVFG